MADWGSVQTYSDGVSRSDTRGWSAHPKWVQAIGKWAWRSQQRMGRISVPKTNWMWSRVHWPQRSVPMASTVDPQPLVEHELLNNWKKWADMMRGACCERKSLQLAS